MYGHNIDQFPASATFPDYNNYPLLDMSTTGVPSITMAMPTISLPLNIDEYNSACQLMPINEGMNNTTYYYESPTSWQQQNTFMQRSVSTLSLHYNNPPPPHFIWSKDSSSDGRTIPVRRACSTGDLQGIKMLQDYRRLESPLISNEESCSSIIQGMSKACRYSPEEKIERIHKYRIKRNLRNFNKTIKYACRKTLADSRPRIRGRFARNDDQIQKLLANHYHHHHQADNEDDHEEENWTSFLEAFSANLVP